MDDLTKLKELLDSNVITGSEYELLVNRIKKNNNKYDYTWGDILNDFCDWALGKYTTVTAKGYKTCLYKFMLYMTKEDNNEKAYGYKFEMYSFRHVNKFISNMESNNYSCQAISKTKYALVVFGDFLHEKLGIEVPDLSGIKTSIKKVVNKTTVALKEDEVLGIANCGELRNKICILLCYEACLRRMELVSLRVQDFNFENNQLFVINKDKEVDRVCIISSNTMNLVKQYIDELYEDIERWNRSRALKGKEQRADYGYLFQSVKTIVPTYSILQVMIKNNAEMYYKSILTQQEDIQDRVKMVTFETIRNSRKVKLLSTGMPIHTVMQISGDKNYMSTQRFSKLVPALYPEIYKED